MGQPAVIAPERSGLQVVELKNAELGLEGLLANMKDGAQAELLAFERNPPSKFGSFGQN